LVLVMFGIWALWSGHFEWLLLGLGLLSAAATVALGARMGIVDEEALPLRFGVRAVRYLPWLLLQIVKANFDVARRVLSPRLSIAPRLVRVRARQHSAAGRAVFANSITLTPGTVTVDVEGEDLLVHALTAEAAQAVLDGEMNRRVAWMDQAR